MTIPANPMRDDDMRIMAYIEQQEALSANAESGALPQNRQERQQQTPYNESQTPPEGKGA